MSVQNQTGFLGFPVPVGAIFPFAGSVLPETYLFCRGQAYDIDEYPDLYKVIGNAVIPDIREAFVGGHGQRAEQGVNQITGLTAPLTITPGEMPSFNASVVDTNITGQVGRIENGVFVVRGAIHNRPRQTRIDGTRFDGLQDGTPVLNSYDVTVTSFTGTYNGGEQPATGTMIPQTFSCFPAYTEIVYIIKAKY
jgi:microcystin-dependent protein